MTASAAMLVAVAVYVVPAALAPSVSWVTTPYGAPLGPSDYYRLPGYFWPVVTLCLYVLALLPSFFPRSLSQKLLPVTLSKVATFLLVLVALFLLQWLVLTPMFS